ncbi:hypothetical protein [Amycolatopsis sp. NPDC051372]|uniref:hypothetical protein n=1 Tax=Amycolatopsis sp. NPDC051372 TaxID=3155669 RepID=UPI003429FCA9
MAVDEPPTIRVLRWGLWLQVPAALMAAGFGVAEVGDSSGWWSAFLVAGLVLDVVAAARSRRAPSRSAMVRGGFCAR